MYYLIKNTLQECLAEDCIKNEHPYVAVLTPEEWQRGQALFDMGIDLDPLTAVIHNTKAEANIDSLTGTFSIPDRNDITGEDMKFSFALDERGVVFIDAGETAQQIVNEVRRTKRWRMPSLARFLYDFLNNIINGDLVLMEKYEKELEQIEQELLNGEDKKSLTRLNEIRGDVLDLRTHYEQLIDMGEVLEENENGFFAAENVRYFRLFTNRVERHKDIAAAMRDYTVQIRDLYQSQLDIKQNHIMTILTVVTTIFMPLTLIVGWYGMNFRYMPELNWKLGYPLVILVSAVIAVGGLIYFKKKKWL
ncbi:MAG: magnesium transporter CorA [Clostridia bacterium]|nr:magnesium transporter CorA [Clostridia bacterium]